MMEDIMKEGGEEHRDKNLFTPTPPSKKKQNWEKIPNIALARIRHGTGQRETAVWIGSNITLASIRHGTGLKEAAELATSVWIGLIKHYPSQY